MKIFITSLFVLCCFTIFGQQEYQTIVLQDGTKIHGKLISVDTDGQVLLETEHLEPLTLKFESIAQISNVSGSLNNQNSFFAVEAGFMANRELLNASIQMNWNYFITDYISTGVGTGIDLFDQDSGYFIFPVYSNITFHTSKSKVRPYASFNLGYGFPLIDEDNNNAVGTKGGIMFNPKFGVKLFNDNFGITIYSGLKFQKASYIYEVWNGEFEEVNKFKRVEFGIGFNF